MKCPYCGKDLKKGNMYSPKTGVIWLPENEKPKLHWDINPPGKQNGLWLIPMYQKGLFSLDFCNLPMYVCFDCEKVIADVEFD